LLHQDNDNQKNRDNYLSDVKNVFHFLSE